MANNATIANPVTHVGIAIAVFIDPAITLACTEGINNDILTTVTIANKLPYQALPPNKPFLK